VTISQILRLKIDFRFFILCSFSFCFFLAGGAVFDTATKRSACKIFHHKWSMRGHLRAAFQTFSNVKWEFHIPYFTFSMLDIDGDPLSAGKATQRVKQKCNNVREVHISRR